MMQPLEIKAADFTEDRYGVIVRAIEGKLKTSYAKQFNTAHFFREWRTILSHRLGRSWETPGAIIGVTFFPNLFTGEFSANVVFWWATEAGKKFGGTLTLLAAAEKAAAEHNCRMICSASYDEICGDLMERLYKRKGYTKSETIFRKEIK